MNIEKKRIESCSVGKKGILYGYIELDKLAVPETVKVTLLGEPIIPKSFDLYGHPIFTEEQALIHMFKEEELKRQNGGKHTTLKAEIIYEERIFDVPRSTFDTVRGIEKSLRNLSSLNEMLWNRKIFCKVHEGEILNKHILFGCFLLDEFGRIYPVKKKGKGKLKTNGDVEDFATFYENNRKDLEFADDIYVIPKEGSICSCCGKNFTIDDVKNQSCVSVGSTLYHYNCWCNFRKLTEIDNFARRIVGYLYQYEDYQFELLPNGYCSQDCCSHIPWFLFHTIDGDIIMGCRERDISIEWQENYKPFDIKKLFRTEHVYKWEKNGKRGIYANDNDKAYEYLKKVLETVNPGYSK